MFRKAYSSDGKTVFYFDSADNKYAATGGSLSWLQTREVVGNTSSQVSATKLLWDKPLQNTEKLQHSPSPRHKALKWGLRMITLLYVLLFPFLFYMAILSSMVSDGPSTTPLMVGVVMSLMFLLPLSVPISIYLTWSRYRRSQSSKALIFAGLPFYTFAGILLTLGILDLLIRHRLPW